MILRFGLRLCEGCREDFRPTGSYQRFCPRCRSARRRRAKRYSWSAEQDELLRSRYDPRVHGRVAELSATLKRPPQAVKQRAWRLGLSMSPPRARRNWTAEERGWLVEHAGTLSIHELAARLERTYSAVGMELSRLGISARNREGYRQAEVARCFGVSAETVRTWAAKGWLRVVEHATNGDRGAWAVTDSDLLRFVLEHPMAFSLRRVDQVWFMDLLTGGGVVKKALAREERLDGEERGVKAS